MIVTKGYPYGVVSKGYGSSSVIEEIIEYLTLSASSNKELDKFLSYDKSVELKTLSNLLRIAFNTYQKNLELDVGSSIENLGQWDSRPNFLFGVGCGKQLSAGSEISRGVSLDVLSGWNVLKEETLVNFLVLSVLNQIPIYPYNVIRSIASIIGISSILNQDLWVRSIPRSPRSAINNTAVGSFNWTNPQVIYYSDNLFSTFSGAGRRSYYLYGYNFSFQIPSNGRIVGIELRIERRASANAQQNNIQDYSVRAYVPGNAWDGRNYRKVGRWSVDEQYVVFGGPTDDWGIGRIITPDLVNDVAFGFGLSVDVAGNATAYVDNFLVYIYWTDSILIHDVFRSEALAGNFLIESKWDSIANKSLSVGADSPSLSILSSQDFANLNIQAQISNQEYLTLIKILSIVISSQLSQSYAEQYYESSVLSIVGSLVRLSTLNSQNYLTLPNAPVISAAYSLSYTKETLLRILGASTEAESKGIMDFITILTSASTLALNNQIDIDSLIEFITNGDLNSFGGFDASETLNLVSQALETDSGVLGLEFVKALVTSASYIRDISNEISTEINLATQAIDLHQSVMEFTHSLSLSIISDLTQYGGYDLLGFLTLASQSSDSELGELDLVESLILDIESSDYRVSQSSIIGVLDLGVESQLLRTSIVEFLADVQLAISASEIDEKEYHIDVSLQLSTSAEILREQLLAFIQTLLIRTRGLDQRSILRTILSTLTLSTNATDSKLDGGTKYSEEVMQTIASLIAEHDLIGLVEYGTELYLAYARERFYKSESRERSPKSESKSRLFKASDIIRLFKSIIRNRSSKSEDRNR